MPADPFQAFVADDDVRADPTGDGPLTGLRFAVADLFDVAGEVTGGGNPDWRRTHDPATATAPVVTRLLAAGAALVGRTTVDELGWGLFGVNPHDGTPRNPAAPDAVPGGSAAGSAVAVAAGLVDFALGTDAEGSVRVPAGLCGAYGFRPTHGALPLDGVLVLAPSFDTVAWLAGDALVLRQVALALLPPDLDGDGDAGEPLARVLVADDLFDAADEPVVDALVRDVQRLVVRLRSEHVPALAADGLEAWAGCERTLLGAEAWATVGDWLSSTNPTLALDLRHRLTAAAEVDADTVTRARAARDQIASRLRDVLGGDGVLVLPTTPEIAPLLTGDDEDFAAFRRRSLALCCVAELAGLPQVTVPVGTLAEYPVGLSLIGPRGSDHRLIALAATIARPAD